MDLAPAKLTFDDSYEDTSDTSSAESSSNDEISVGGKFAQKTPDKNVTMFSCDFNNSYTLDLSATPSAFDKCVGQDCTDSGIATPTPSAMSKKQAKTIYPDSNGNSPTNFREPVRLNFFDSVEDNEDLREFVIRSPIKSLTTSLSRPLPIPAMFNNDYQSNSKEPPISPPSKTFHALRLYDTPHTPKSLLEKSMRSRSSMRRPTRSKGSEKKSLLDPEGPQANVNPFTESPRMNSSIDATKSRSNSKGVKRSRLVLSDIHLYLTCYRMLD